jgi:lipid II isoglutaminyl synthase (glutamine-hydrolysing)
VHLYPKEMNIYGDNGNVLILQQRLQWRGINNRVINCGVGDQIPIDSHLIIGGGGQDKGQSLISDDLAKKAAVLKTMALSGLPMLMICGMYQMFGHYFLTQESNKIRGLGIIDAVNEAKAGRLIGNITVSTEWGDVVGYENHSGRTYLQNSAVAFGSTIEGCGNNGQDKTEGAIVNNVFGTYMHGPVLAKSPNFVDHLLSLAISFSNNKHELTVLDDSLEKLAASVAKKRPR